MLLPKRNRIAKYGGLLLVLFISLQFACCRRSSKREIRFWHAYTGLQASALRELVSEYNRTEGARRGVEIIAYYKGDLLEISDYLNSRPADELPNILQSTENAAYLAYLNSRIVSAEEGLPADRLTDYISGFLDSGRFTLDGESYLFPLTANLTVMYLNESLFSDFAAETPGVQTRDLRYWNDLYALAAEYYAWTDAQTAQTPGDGKAFLAIEDLASYIFTVSNQYAASVVQPGHKGIQIVLNYEMLRQIWNFYFSGGVRGYISVLEDSPNSQMEQGQLICYLASTESSKWVPESFRDCNGTIRNTEVLVKPYPNVSAAQIVVPQQVSGVVVPDHGTEENTEAYCFLDWMSRNADIYRFCLEGRCLPTNRTVLQNAEVLRKVESYISDTGKNRTISVAYSEAYTEAASLRVYSPTVFYDSESFAEALARSLQTAAQNGREAVLAYTENGIAYEEAVAAVDTDAAFASWLQELETIKAGY